MDIAKYKTSKIANKVTLQKYGDSYQFVQRQYNPETGLETAPITGTFTEEQLLAQKTAVQASLDSINEMLADVQILKTSS
mgnify:CR=1 FL=1